MKRLHIASLIGTFITTCVLLITSRPISKSECWICSGRFQSYISYESSFGIINLNSRIISTIPNNDWDKNYNVTIDSSEGGSIIITSNLTPDSYCADISRQEGSRPDQSIMSKYLCADCVKIYSTIKNDLLLMDAATGTPFLISDDMELDLPPYAVIATPQKNGGLRLTFKRTQ